MDFMTPVSQQQLQEHFTWLQSYTEILLEYMTTEVENNKHHTDESKYLRYLVRDILSP